MSILDNVDEPRGKQTELLLKCISGRLSGRQDCRDVNYKVKINNSNIMMEPLIYVYKNRYQRKEIDRLDIISYVCKYKFNSNSEIFTNLVPGTYIYESTLDNKKRRWRKLD